MTELKKNFARGFYKKNYRKVAIFVFTGLVFTGVLFSNKLSAQPVPSVSVNISGNSTICEPLPIAIHYLITSGTAPFTFTYSINGLNQPSISTNSRDTTFTQTFTAGTHSDSIYTYSLVDITDHNYSNVSPPPPGVVLSFTVNPQPFSEVKGDVEVCQFDPVVHVKFYASGGTAPYTMNYTQNGVSDSIPQNQNYPGFADHAVSTSDAGPFVFALRGVRDNNGCAGTIGNNDTATVIVDQHPSAHFSINPGRVSNLEPTITINNLSVAPANSNWVWDFGDSSPPSYFADPGTHTYKDTGTYNVQLHITTNSNAGTSCDDNTSQNIRVYLPFSLYVPSAFSPNNDGINDVFNPKADGIKLKEYDMTIYDRWGNKMFYTNDLNKGWDGTVNGGSKIVPIDAYVYVINLVTDEDGKTYIFYGSVTSTLR